MTATAERFWSKVDNGLPSNAGYELGLDATTAREREYAALTALWREEIIDRRAAWFDAHPEAVLA